MASILPFTLSGENLGKRHMQINDLVKQSYDAGVKEFKNTLNTPDKTAIDRLFKIDLASKHRDVDYIIHNLKDSDMLYVSRALKALWILEPQYQTIISPDHLEDNIYPHMVTTAVNKMKHWLHLNLKDEQRSQDLYQYYKSKDFELAIKFLVKTSKDFIENEFVNIVEKVNPKYFKMLCEKSPNAAKIFFDSLETDEMVKTQYIENDKKFYNSIKCILKSDANLFLDITEKYFDVHKFDRFSSIATKFIMSQHKERFQKKPELYTAWILNTATLAESLNVEEIKELIETLARAKYLQSWFEYKNVEPLIKRLKPEDRAAFKKKVFVEKNIGKEVEEWPYKLPSAPSTEDLGPDIFEDSKHSPCEYNRMGSILTKKLKCLTKRKYACRSEYMDDYICEMASCPKVKTMLDKLFDEYRFFGFEKTFYELQKRILSESSSQNRQYIMLVLISKTGGRADAIATLAELLARHSNEPANLRAAIIRSLVKKAFIWRLSEDTWMKILQFGQGLGLDGKPAEADCVEGLHSVIIRSLLQNGSCNESIFNAFLDNFSDLSAYSLNSTEKKCISETLPKMLLSAAKDKDEVKDAIHLIYKLVTVLETYKAKTKTYYDLIQTVIDLAEKDNSACSSLIEKLFNAKVGRKALFRFTYKLIKTDASHINALKHDISVLDFEVFYESCTTSKCEQFLRKIAIYFNENGGLAMQYKNKLKEKEQKKFIGRPLAILLGNDLESYLQELDSKENVESKVFAAIIRANAHMAKPGLDIDAFGWRKAGVKMIANKLIACPRVDLKTNIQKLLEWKRTARLAFVFSNRTEDVTSVFLAMVKLRPTIGIKMGIKLLKKQGDAFDIKIWETLKQLLQNADLNKNIKQFYVHKLFTDVDSLPIKIQPDYNIIIYESIIKLDESCQPYSALPFLCRIEHLLPNVSEDFIESVITKFLEKDFILEKITEGHYQIKVYCLYLRVLFLYIYYSKTEKVQHLRFETFGNKVLDCMTQIFNKPSTNKVFFQYLDEIMLSFKNTKVFMNPEYVSCLPVMEKTVSWIQTILPIEQNFEIYAKIHLTMLYYKTIRQTVKQEPDVFETERKKYKEGVTIVGNLFGKYIAKEVRELMDKYFESVIYLYKDAIVSYLDSYFDYIQSSDFISAMIKGIIEEGKGEVRLGMYLLKDKYYSLKEEVSAELNNSIGEVDDLKNKFFVFAELLTN